MADDGLELLLEAVLDDLRQVLAVERAGLLVGHLADLLVGARDLRRVEVVGDWLEALDLVGDLARIRHDGFVGRLLAEVLELLEHLVRRAQVEWRLQLGVVEALALHEDGAVDAVLRVEEVDVAGRNERLAELLGNLSDLEVNLDEVIVRLDIRVLVAALEEVVVVDGLDLEVVVERGDLHELLVRALLLDGADELAGLAGGADEQATAVFFDDVLRQARLAVEVAQVRERDELVEVAQAVGVLGEHDDVVGALLQVVLLDEVALHAVDDLEVTLAAAQGLGGIREGLHDAVIGDSDGGPAPAVGRLDEVLDGDDGVHAAHRRVRMELDTLDLGAVLAALLLLLGEAVDEEHVLIHEGVEAHGTLHAHGHALFERGHDFVAVGLRLAAFAAASLREELLAGDAVRVVGDAEGQELRARLEFEQADARARALADRTLDDDALDLTDELRDLVERARDAAAEDEVAPVLHNDRLVQVIVLLGRLLRGFSQLCRCGWLSCCSTVGRSGRLLIDRMGGCRRCIIGRAGKGRRGDAALPFSVCQGGLGSCALGFGAAGLLVLQGLEVVGGLEAVIDLEVLQDFLAGLALDVAAVADALLDELAHGLRDGMGAHDLAAELAGHVDEDVAAVDGVLRALEELVDGRVALGRLVDELRPDLRERVFDVDDVLIEDDGVELVLRSDLVRGRREQVLREQRLRAQRDLPAVRARADLDMADRGRPQERLLLLFQPHALHELPEHILLTRDNPEFLHQVPSFRIDIEKTGTTCRHWILLLYYMGYGERLQEAVHRHSTLTCSQSLV